MLLVMLQMFSVLMEVLLFHLRFPLTQYNRVKEFSLFKFKEYMIALSVIWSMDYTCLTVDCYSFPCDCFSLLMAFENLDLSVKPRVDLEGNGGQILFQLPDK